VEDVVGVEEERHGREEKIERRKERGERREERGERREERGESREERKSRVAGFWSLEVRGQRSKVRYPGRRCALSRLGGETLTGPRGPGYTKNFQGTRKESRSSAGASRPV
jgi:hypothetical protein